MRIHWAVMLFKSIACRCDSIIFAHRKWEKQTKETQRIVAKWIACQVALRIRPLKREEITRGYKAVATKVDDKVRFQRYQKPINELKKSMCTAPIFRWRYMFSPMGHNGASYRMREVRKYVRGWLVFDRFLGTLHLMWENINQIFTCVDTEPSKHFKW